MARKLRVQYSEAMHHVMNRGDRQEAILELEERRKADPENVEDRAATPCSDGRDLQVDCRASADGCSGLFLQLTTSDQRMKTYKCAQLTLYRKLEIAARLRRETTLSIKAIAARVHLGSSKAANANLHAHMNQRTRSAATQAQLGF